MAKERDDEIAAMGRAVKAARTEKGWSLRHLAERAGVSASLISAVENARIVPTVSSLFAVSDALGVPAGTFLPDRHRRSEDRRAELVTGSSDGPAATEDVQGGMAADSLTDRARFEDVSTRRQPGTGIEDRASIASAASPSSFTSDRPPSRRDIVLRGQRISSRRRDRAGQRRFPEELVTGTEPGSVHQPGPGDVTTATADGGYPPGVQRVDPPAIGLGDGTSWHLLAGRNDHGARLIEVRLGDGDGEGRPHVMSGAARIVSVIRGVLAIEAGFTMALFGSGSIIRIEAGVPYRFIGRSADVSLYVFVLGSWDGKI